MQTFLPYPDFAESMRVLDPSRLGNQIYREGLTLLSGGWPNHPASRMWASYRYQLARYCLAGIEELRKRGLDYPEVESVLVEIKDSLPVTNRPHWLGREDFHASHRSNLLRKDPVWYGKFGWTEPPDLPYVWPSVVNPVMSKPKLLKKGRSSAQSPRARKT